MNKETLTALQESIVHWKRVLNHTNTQDFAQENLGRKTCALCTEFNAAFCIQCPVSLKTNHISCNKTPYINALRAKQLLLQTGYTLTPIQIYKQALNRWQVCCIREINFLESLLP